MLIRDVMTKKVISVSPESLIEDVAGLLIGNKIHGVPVVENGKPVGMITETDFFTKGSVTLYLPQYIDFLKRDKVIGKLSEEGRKKIDILLDTRAKDIMSSPCITMRTGEGTDDFFKLIQEKKLTSVPVVDEDGSLVGIVTLSDIMHLIDLKK